MIHVYNLREYLHYEDEMWMQQTLIFKNNKLLFHVLDFKFFVS